MFQRDLWPLFDGWGESLHVNPLKNALVHVVWDFLNPDSHNIPAGNSPCFKVWTLERTSLCVHTGSDWIFWFLWSPSDVHKESGVTLPPPPPSVSDTSAPPSVQPSWPEARQLPSCSSPAHQIPTAAPQCCRLAGPRHCRARHIRDWKHGPPRPSGTNNMQTEKILSDDAVINPEESVFMCTYSW